MKIDKNEYDEAVLFVKDLQEKLKELPEEQREKVTVVINDPITGVTKVNSEEGDNSPNGTKGLLVGSMKTEDEDGTSLEIGFFLYSYNNEYHLSMTSLYKLILAEEDVELV